MELPQMLAHALGLLILKPYQELSSFGMDVLRVARDICPGVHPKI